MKFILTCFAITFIIYLFCHIPIWVWIIIASIIVLLLITVILDTANDINNNKSILLSEIYKQKFSSDLTYDDIMRFPGKHQNGLVNFKGLISEIIVQNEEYTFCYMTINNNSYNKILLFIPKEALNSGEEVYKHINIEIRGIFQKKETISNETFPRIFVTDITFLEKED